MENTLHPLDTWHHELARMRDAHPGVEIVFVGTHTELEAHFLRPLRNSGGCLQILPGGGKSYNGVEIIPIPVDRTFRVDDGGNVVPQEPPHFELRDQFLAAAVEKQPEYRDHYDRTIANDSYQDLIAQIKAAREKAVQAAQEESRKIASEIGYPLTLNLPGCVVNCDQCRFPHLDRDLEALAWPLVDACMWDSATKLDVVVKGELPLKPGEIVVLEQAADRILSWIPHTIQIATKWDGPPQPGLVQYQWSIADAHGRVDVQVAWMCDGLRFEPAPGIGNLVPFPTYKGADAVVIGREARLRLHATLAPGATSTLEEILVVVNHKGPGDFAPEVPKLEL